MFDPFFSWLEETALSVWIREAPSIFVFPMILAVHTIGLGLLAGINAALDLRLLGFARDVPVVAFRRLLPVMWAGLWLNLASGIALVLAYPTKALTNPVFYLKLILVAGGLSILRQTGRTVLTDGPLPDNVRTLAVASLVCWAGAITSGRFLAYTYLRLMATWEYAWPY